MISLKIVFFLVLFSTDAGAKKIKLFHQAFLGIDHSQIGSLSSTSHIVYNFS